MTKLNHSGAPSINLAFSLCAEAPLASLEKARASAGEGLEPQTRIVKLGPVEAVDLRDVPIVDISDTHRKDSGTPVYRADLGSRSAELYEQEAVQLAFGVDRYNGAGGKFIWLAYGRCAVNLSQVFSVKAVARGCKVKVEFAGGERIWGPFPRAEVTEAVSRFAQGSCGAPVQEKKEQKEWRKSGLPPAAFW